MDNQSNFFATASPSADDRLTRWEVKGKWRYLYRAVDSSRATLDFLLSAKQDAVAAKRFLVKALGGANHPAPRVINTDGHAAYWPAVAQLKAEGALAEDSGIGQCLI